MFDTVHHQSCWLYHEHCPRDCSVKLRLFRDECEDERVGGCQSSEDQASSPRVSQHPLIGGAWRRPGRWWWHWRIKAQDKQDYFNWCCHQDATVEIKFCDLKICFRFEFDVWHMLVMNLNLISYCVQNTINDQFLLLKCLSTSMNFLWSMCRMFVVWILCCCLKCYRVHSWELVNIAADNCDNSCSSEHDSHNAY